MQVRYKGKGIKKFRFNKKEHDIPSEKWVSVPSVKMYKKLRSYPDTFDVVSFFDVAPFANIDKFLRFDKNLIYTTNKTIVKKLKKIKFLRHQSIINTHTYVFKILNYDNSNLSRFDHVDKKVSVFIHRDLGGIGDIILTTPILEAARKQYGNYNIVYSCPEQFIPLLKDNPNIDHLSSLTTELTQRDWDIVVDVSSDCIKYEIANQPDVKLNRAEVFADKCGFDIKDIGSPKVYLNTDEISAAKKELEPYKLKIGLVLKSHALVRNWPYFDDLKHKLLKDYKDATIIEFSHIQPTDWTITERAHPVFDRSLREVMALLNECDVVVSPDTGLAHISSALRIPTVWIFTHIDGNIRTKNYDNVKVCQIFPKDCPQGKKCWYSIPCSSNSEKTQLPLCSSGITVSQVMKEVDSFLSAPNVSYCLQSSTKAITEKRNESILKYKKYNDEIVPVGSTPKGRYKVFFNNLLQTEVTNSIAADGVFNGCTVSKDMPKKTTKKKVSIIIPVHNGYLYTRNCIKSIMAHFSCNYEIIIVDNGSLDNTEDLANEFPIKYIRYDRPLGFSLPNNIGAKHASGDYLLFMNNDIEVYEDIFLSLAKGFKKDVELVGCHAAVLKENEFGILTHVGQVYDMKDKDSYLEGWCILIKKKVFNKLGGFTEGYKIALSEDADLGYKIKHFGYKSELVQGIKINHFGSTTLKSQMFFDIERATANNNTILTERWKHKKIILQRKGAIGDVLMVTPIIRKAKEVYPDHELIFSTSEDCSEILQNNPFIDTLEFGNVKGAVVLDYEWFPEGNRLEVMSRQAGVELDYVKPEMYFTNSEVEYKEKFFADMKRCVALHTGRSWKNRELDIDKWKTVAKWLDDKGYTVLQFGDSNTEKVDVGQDLTNLSIRQTAVLMAGCEFFVGIDSLVAHLAKAADIPQVIAYGCTDPKVLKNSDKEYPVWISDLECAGCQQTNPSATYTECDKDKIHCVDRITPEIIIKSISKIIKAERVTNE